MNELLTLPDVGPTAIGRAAAETVRGGGEAPSYVQIRDRLTAVQARMRRDVTSDDPVEAAVAELFARNGAGTEDDAARLAVELAGRAARLPHAVPEATWERFFYAAAGGALAQERVAEAILLLAALAATPGGRPDGLLGLAVCGARLKYCEEALALANEAHRLAPGHPRANCVAGLCELERGNRKAAKARLAAAARLARHHPEFAEDLRMAQRTLILMQIA